jgi:hypothetical protein
MIESLVEAVRAHQAIFFVGAGVSKGLGLPLWSELIGEMGRQLGYDEAVFSLHGSYPELAEYYKLMRSTIGPLRSWMDRTWHEDEDRIEDSKTHRLLAEMAPYAIYTTNYDRWLEIAFRRFGKKYVKVANVGDFANIVDGVTQIVKFHGDFDDDASLVLTETDYFERLALDTPLDIKLRADAMGKTLFFIGYSLEDINIRLMLYRLHRIWERSDFATVRPKSYVFLSRPNPVQEAILERRGLAAIVSGEDDPKAGLEKLLDRIAHEAFGAGPIK